MTYRVIQWATGNVGRAAIEGIVTHPDLELVGCYVYSDQKAGRDVGELCGLGPARRHRHQRRRRDPGPRRRLRRLQPHARQPARRRAPARVGQERRDPGRLGVSRSAATTSPRSRRRAAEGGATLHGTGIHPGGITEQFPLMLSALLHEHPPRARRGVLRHPHLRRPSSSSAT